MHPGLFTSVFALYVAKIEQCIDVFAKSKHSESLINLFLSQKSLKSRHLTEILPENTNIRILYFIFLTDPLKTQLLYKLTHDHQPVFFYSHASTVRARKCKLLQNVSLNR